MSSNLIRDVCLVGAMCVGLGLAAPRYLDWRDGRLNTPQTEPDITADTAAPPSAPVSASVVVLPKNPRDGQFWTQARVDRGSVKFLVDTGAGMVALTSNDARAAGIKLDQLQYTVPIRTAGGENMAAAVTLDHVTVGGITIRNVAAIVVPKGLDTSLLGMTFLGELQKVEATPHQLTLRY